LEKAAECEKLDAMSQRDFDFAIGTGDEFYGPANFARGGLGANIPQGRGVSVWLLSTQKADR
jgi:hypothetical protein